MQYSNEAAGGGGLDDQNRVLSILPIPERVRVLSFAERVCIQRRQVLHHYQLSMDHIYFIEQGLVSVAAKVGDEKFVEVWLVGSDGIVGAPLILEGGSKSLYRCTVLVGGHARRIPVSELRRLLAELPALRALLNRYLAAVLAQASQTSACNSVHHVKQRLVRWLLMARNATKTNEIPLTHDALSRLLGVRRASVTECLEALEGETLLSTSRAKITIQKHVELETRCCECIRRMSREYERHMSCAAADG
jgi:CRP-like cAMP-binding protein